MKVEGFSGEVFVTATAKNCFKLLQEKYAKTYGITVGYYSDSYIIINHGVSKNKKEN